MPDASAARSDPSATSARVSAVVARLRVPIGFVSAVGVFWLARPSRSTLVAGTIIAALGESVRIWAAGHLRKAREVTISGPYRWSAHPLYVGSSVMGVGLAIACGSLPAAVWIALYVAVTFTLAAKREEASLRANFGDEYDRYQRARMEGVDSSRRFSVAQAMANREYRALIGLIVAILLLALKAASGV